VDLWVRVSVPNVLSLWDYNGSEGMGVYGGKDLRKRYLLSLEWKRVGVMGNEIGDDETDERREFD